MRVTPDALPRERRAKQGTSQASRWVPTLVWLLDPALNPVWRFGVLLWISAHCGSPFGPIQRELWISDCGEGRAEGGITTVSPVPSQLPAQILRLPGTLWSLASLPGHCLSSGTLKSQCLEPSLSELGLLPVEGVKPCLGGLWPSSGRGAAVLVWGVPALGHLC